ncbi:SigE family RNA polymerase sigma factor [Streptomyces sp. NPDC005955]|uniref:SigE family RNA polymerase sigma factor n=1 Tax=Streptomyces sp. NPDC005955 TaxID=3364738 RepID=UPI003683E5B9
MNAEDERGFREFVANRSSALLRTAVLLTGGDRHAAEDLLQGALLKVVARWRRIDDHEAYVRRVLYRQQVDRWRLKWPRRELTVAEPPEAAAPADAHANAELRIVLLGALARLTARQRTVLVLRYFEDLPEAEVADVLGCSVGTVRSTAHRSLARLRTLAPELTARAATAPDAPPDAGRAPWTPDGIVYEEVAR